MRRLAICQTLVFGSPCGAVELIRNGSFEEGGFSTGRLFTGWDESGGRGFNILEYPNGDCGSEWCSGTGGFIIPGPPSGGISGPAGRGEFYAFAFSTGRFVDGEVEFEGFAAQIVDLRGYDGMPFEFSTWLASTVTNGDYAIVSLEIYSEPDATGELLDTIVFDGNDLESGYVVGSANSEGLADIDIPSSQDNWTLFGAQGLFPLEAQSAVVRIRGDSTEVTGFDNNAYVDLVSLQVIPEPTSIVLLLGVSLSLLCWWRRIIVSAKGVLSRKTFTRRLSIWSLRPMWDPIWRT